MSDPIQPDRYSDGYSHGYKAGKEQGFAERAARNNDYSAGYKDGYALGVRRFEAQSEWSDMMTPRSNLPVQNYGDTDPATGSVKFGSTQDLKDTQSLASQVQREAEKHRMENLDMQFRLANHGDYTNELRTSELEEESPKRKWTHGESAWGVVHDDEHAPLDLTRFSQSESRKSLWDRIKARITGKKVHSKNDG